MLHRLAEFIPWNWFLGSINVYKYGLRLNFHLLLFLFLSGEGIEKTFPVFHMFLFFLSFAGVQNFSRFVSQIVPIFFFLSNAALPCVRFPFSCPRWVNRNSPGCTSIGVLLSISYQRYKLFSRMHFHEFLFSYVKIWFNYSLIICQIIIWNCPVCRRK